MLLKKYKEEAIVDYLTGLNNYRSFNSMYGVILTNAINKGEQLSVLFIDIDHFKKVNDTYGHPEGDIVLKKLGELLKSNTRSYDIVSRNGGEEFSVILLDLPLENAANVGEKLRTIIEGTSFELSDGTIIHITVSVGVANYPTTTADPDNLLVDADKALYKAKKAGRNMVIVKE
nr:GGDEF domain-containing protein [Evansella tamaricis]